MYNDALGGALQERFVTVLRVEPFGISPGYAMQLVREGTAPEGDLRLGVPVELVGYTRRELRAIVRRRSRC